MGWCDKSLYLHYHNNYGPQIRQHGNLPLWAPTQNFTWSFNHVAFWDDVTNHNCYNLTTTVPLATKLDRMVIYLEGLLILFIKPFNALITWSYKVTRQTKIIIFPLPEIQWRPNLQDDNLPWWAATNKDTRPSCDKLNRYICNVTVFIANKFSRMASFLKWLLPIKYMTLWLSNVVRSRAKLKPLYLHYYNVYGHQNW